MTSVGREGSLKERPPIAVSISIDVTQIADFLKGIPNLLPGKSVIKDDELGWTSRLIGVVCDSKLWRASKGKRYGRVVGSFDEFIPLGRLTQVGGSVDARKVMRRLLRGNPGVLEELQEDIRRRLLQATKRRGKKVDGCKGDLSVVPAKRKRITVSSWPLGTGGGMKVRYDYALTVRRGKYIWELKGTKWDG